MTEIPSVAEVARELNQIVFKPRNMKVDYWPPRPKPPPKPRYSPVIDHSAPDRIKAILRAKKLTYKDVADMLGVSDSAVYNVVNGYTVGLEPRRRFADAIEWDMEDLWRRA